VLSGSPERGWPPRTALDHCVQWLALQAEEVARRDPPLAGGKLYLNDHGTPHIQKVLGFAEQLVSPGFMTLTITDVEKATLYAAALAHDLGLYQRAADIAPDVVRREHARLGAEWLRARASDGRLPAQFARVLELIVGAHSRSVQISSIENYTYIADPSQMNLRTRLLAAMLRIADALDIGQGRTPIAVYRAFEDQIPPASVGYWQAHALVTGSELDLRHREVVLHLEHDADASDPHLRTLYRALQSEFELIPPELWDVNGCVRLHIVFGQGGRRIEPGEIYAKKLADGAAS
jgi:hypothetical protein